MDERRAGSRSVRGPLEGTLGRSLGRAVGAVATPLYAVGIGRRNRRFDAGVGVTLLDRPVISIGNLSVGGTGKTPMVARVVTELARAGKRPCIAMRGYKHATTSDGVSDEAVLYARLVPGVPVVAQADRIAGLRAMFATPAGAGVDCVVLDDGFQHRKIARDVDIVLVDASAGTLDDRLLPAGWLREGWESLRRAHAVVVTHAERATVGEVERLVVAAQRVHAGIVTAVCRHAWTGLLDQPDTVLPPEWLRGKRVFGVCAIGNPGAFVQDVERRSGGLVGTAILADHDPYLPSTVERVAAEIRAARPDVVICTEKDWVKLRAGAEQFGRPVVRPRLEMEFDRGWEDVWTLVAGAARISPGAPTLSGESIGGGGVASA